MAKSRVLLALDNTSNATYDLWAQKIEDAILACGWAVSGDTGQTDPHSNPARPSSGSYNYRVYKAQDTFAGSQDIYLRFDYGSVAAQTNPSFKFQTASATDGAGTLTTNATTTYTYPAVSTGSQTQSRYLYYSGDAGNLRLYHGSQTANQSFALVIERIKDTAGVPTNTGYSVINGSGSVSGSFGSCQCTVIYGVGAYAPSAISTAQMGLIGPEMNGTSTYSGNNGMAVGPVFHVYGQLGTPIASLLIVGVNDVGIHNTFTAAMFGQSRRYLRMNSQMGVGTSSLTNARLAIAWDTVI